MISAFLTRKSNLLIALPFFLLTACRDSSNWVYQAEPRRGMKSAELSCEPAVLHTGMRLQMVKTEGDIHHLLSIFVGKFSLDEQNNTTIHFLSDQIKHSFKAHCMEGGQRCVIPENIALIMKEQLSHGHEVVLYTKYQSLKLQPADFNKLYKKFEKF